MEVYTLNRNWLLLILYSEENLFVTLKNIENDIDITMCNETLWTVLCSHVCQVRKTRHTYPNPTTCIMHHAFVSFPQSIKCIPWLMFITCTISLFFLFPFYICLKQSEPSLTAKFTTTNDTISNRYLIGDVLLVNWTVEHMENTSYEEAKSVRVSFYSNTLKILKVTYNDSQSLIIKDDFHSDEIFVSTLSPGKWL